MQKFILLLLMLLFVFSCGRYSYLTEEQWLDLFGDDSDGDGSVNYNAVYVSTANNPGGTGLLPSDTTSDINNAISIALASGRNEVHVATGDYNTSSITLESGILLLGGYSNDFKIRNIIGFPTKIILGSTWGIIASSTGSVTVISGFDISCSGAQTIHFQYGTDNMIISENIIRNTSGGAGNNIGIVILDCDNVTVLNNQIICSFTSGGSTGIQNTNSNVFAINNVIKAGGGSNSNGIELRTTSELRGCFAEIRNNTVDNGAGSTLKCCIYIYDDSGAFDVVSVIENNIFASQTLLTSSYGVFVGAGSYTLNRSYNLYYNLNAGPLGLGIYDKIMSPADCNFLFMNYSVSDYHLRDYNTLLVNFTTIGYSDVEAGFVVAGGAILNYNRDKDGRSRTISWSLGAYEQDN